MTQEQGHIDALVKAGDQLVEAMRRMREEERLRDQTIVAALSIYQRNIAEIADWLAVTR